MALSEHKNGILDRPAVAAVWGSARRLIPVIALAVVFVALPLAIYGLGLLEHAQSNDEAFYLPLIDFYAPRPWFTPVLHTNEAPISIGPIFFIAHRAWSGAFGAGDIQARALSLACMMMGSVVWLALGRQLRYTTGPTFALAFWLLPYHAVVAIAALTEPYMLFFLLAAVLCWVAGVDADLKALQRRSILYFCGCGLCLGVAQNAKPPLITVSLALMAIGTVRLGRFWAVFGPFLAIAMQVPCWLAWGGLFPPGQRMGMMPQFAARSGLFPDTSLHLLCVAGTVLWPAVNLQMKPRELFAVLATGLVAWHLCGPDLGETNPDRFRFVGPMLQASYRGDFVRYAYLLPFLAGWMLFWDSIRMICRNQVSIARQALLFAPVMSIVGFMRSPLGFDRYASCFMALWWLGLWPELQKRPRALTVSMVFMVGYGLILVARVAFVRQLLLI